MNLPNKLSLIRILLVPFLVVFLLTRWTKWNDILALIVFIIASLTDWLDGYIARNSQQITTIGQFLDPVADKLLISAAFISLVEIQRIPAWIVVVIVGRELLVTGLRTIAASYQIIIPAARLGKYKVVCETAAIIMLIIDLPYSLGIISAWIAMILALWSGAEYFIKFQKRIVIKW